MLGVLVVFLQFLLYGYCWKLNRGLSALKKSGNTITTMQFLWCSVINFIVLVPILTFPFYFLGLFFGLEKYLGESGFVVFGILMSLILVFCIIAYQYSKYKNCIKSSGLLKTAIDKSKIVTSSAKVALFSPSSFIETYTFIDFVKLNGSHVGIVTHTNKMTGDKFCTVDIKDSEGKTVSVRFHSSLGELTAEQLKCRKEELFVGKRAIDHRWYLYDTHYKDNSWQDVDLGV